MNLADKLYKTADLSDEELKSLIETDDQNIAEALRQYADETRRKHYGGKVFLRGLIEISSYCKNDCLYCGLRRSNTHADRYRLSIEDILACCDNGYKLGFRTFVMQGGEDVYYNDDILCG
ncbi:MAG: [Spirochaetales bacterium]|nr:[FeFe] hydrogenase H-cluster radical SAM maturase HydE [Spirochaetales bacterium]